MVPTTSDPETVTRMTIPVNAVIGGLEGVKMKVIPNQPCHGSTHKARLAFAAIAVACVANCGTEVADRTTPDGWEVLRNDSFSFAGPHDLRKVPGQGIDSFVGRFQSHEFYISFDYGWYSDDSFDGHLSRANESTFQVEEVRVNGKRARLGSYADNDHPESHPFVYAAYFPDVLGTGEGKAGETKLYFRVCYKDPESKERARLILTSIRFNE